MKIVVCIGSSCHLKGSRQVVEELRTLIEEKGLQEQMTLSGAFCMGDCVHGVNVSVDGDRFSVMPADTRTFFESVLLPRL